MSVLESVQFEVGLTRDTKILKQLKLNKLWRQDADGAYLSIQFDATDFKFRPGKTFLVGKSVGNALIRSSAVLLGRDPLSDPYVPFVVKIAENQLGDSKTPVVGTSKPQFACPMCGEDMKTGPKLARHLMDKNAHPMKDDEVEESDIHLTGAAAAEASIDEINSVDGVNVDSVDGADESEGR